MHILAIDLGTSSIKFMRLDERAGVLSIDRVPSRPLDVARWMSHIRANIAARGDGDSMSALAITGQMHGLVAREANAWKIGIPWHDQRSADMVPALQKMLGRDAVTTTGGPIAAGFQAATLAWIRAHQPDYWERIERVCLPKDALIEELTGHHVTDPSDAVSTGLYAPEQGDWAWKLINALGVPSEWLPRIIPSGAIVGPVTQTAAGFLGIRPDAKVIIGGGDAPVGAYGAGVSHEGEALVMLSSGGQIILPTDTWKPDPDGRWYTWPSVAPQSSRLAPYLRVGTLLNGGNVTEWAKETIVDGPLPDAPSGIVALPHLIGTREQPEARGAIVGITSKTTSGEIRRALIEGLAFSVRRKLEEMNAGGGTPSRLRVGGGLASAPGVRQIFADALGIPCEQVAHDDLSVYGAGLLAILALTDARPESATTSAGIVAPQAIYASHYEKLYGLYCDLDEMMTSITSRGSYPVSDRA